MAILNTTAASSHVLTVTSTLGKVDVATNRIIGKQQGPVLLHDRWLHEVSKRRDR